MSVQEMRAEARRIVEEVDEQSLVSLIAQYGNPKSRFIEGEPGVTVEQYNREIDEAMARMNAGQKTSHEDLVAFIEQKYGFKRAH